jgi:hypothetical protein
MLVLGLALVALLALAPPAKSATVSPSCVPTGAGPVTITIPGLTAPPISPGDQFTFGVTSPSGPGAVLATLSQVSYTPVGFTATAVFDQVSPAGPPILPADGILIVSMFTARGITTPIGRVKFGHCDTPAPTITSNGPADGTNAVALEAPVFAVFSKAMDQAATAAAFSLVRTRDGSRVGGSVGFFGDRVALFHPSEPLAPGTQYTATISASATAEDGGSLSAPQSWTFTTIAPPAIVVVSPADAATGVPRVTRVVVAFDRPMDAASVQRAFKLARAGDGKPVTSAVSLIAGGRVAVLSPRHRLAPARRFVATVSAEATDRDGIALGAVRKWSFTTGLHLR